MTNEAELEFENKVFISKAEVQRAIVASQWIMNNSQPIVKTHYSQGSKAISDIRDVLFKVMELIDEK